MNYPLITEHIEAIKLAEDNFEQLKNLRPVLGEEGELMPQPFAYGDLKSDNILVMDDGTLVLVDYDGMYAPAMKGQKARELGSPDFWHPARIGNDFDEHIDDFPLASNVYLTLYYYNFLCE